MLIIRVIREDRIRNTDISRPQPTGKKKGGKNMIVVP